MKTAAVICEYNPMHEGHVHMLETIRARMGEECCVLCLMSGDFVQRGEPAVYEKYRRAREAVARGADLVLELPYPWSSSVAEHFAFGAVSILRDLGGVDRLYFGCENKSGEELRDLAELTSGEEFLYRLRALRRTDATLSYPRLYEKCLAEFKGDGGRLMPNEILSLSYVRTILEFGEPFSFEPLSIEEGYSAGALREKIRLNGEADAAFLETGERAILMNLLLGGGKDRFSRAARGSASLKELFERAGTPSDTDARLRRDLLCLLLKSSGTERQAPRFTVLLASDGRGRAWLSASRKTRRIPIVVKQARAALDETGERQFALYKKARDLYACFSGRQARASELSRQNPFAAGK